MLLLTKQVESRPILSELVVLSGQAKSLELLSRQVEPLAVMSLEVDSLVVLLLGFDLVFVVSFMEVSMVVVCPSLLSPKMGRFMLRSKLGLFTVLESKAAVSE